MLEFSRKSGAKLVLKIGAKSFFLNFLRPFVFGMRNTTLMTFDCRLTPQIHTKFAVTDTSFC